MPPLSPLRAAFLDCAAITRDLLARPEVATRWNEPSALAEFSVRGVAGHLARAVTIVADFLDAERPGDDDPLVDAVGYYVSVLDSDDIQAELHRGIRLRGEEMSADGPVALVRLVGDRIVTLTDRLRLEPADRRIASRGGAAMLLDDYLVTRLVELTVHIDDLVVSVGIASPDLPKIAVRSAVDCCWALARHKHGDRAVLNALTRRERDTVRALKVF